MIVVRVLRCVRIGEVGEAFLSQEGCEGRGSQVQK